VDGVLVLGASRVTNEAPEGLMPTSPPLVTIGLPVYNGEASIKRALGSLIDQDYPNVEIIVSDNASTDATLKICRRILRGRPNARVIAQPINRGPHANFEAVVREAGGEFFMWAADDDVWRPHFVSSLVTELLEHPEACVAMCGVERRREDDSPFDIVRFVGELSPNGMPPSRLGPMTMSAKFNLFIYGLFRTEILKKGIGEFPRALGGDRMFVTQFALAHQFRYVDELQYLRTHRADHDRAYVEESAQRGAKFRQVMAFASMIVRSRVIPPERKLGLPAHVLKYARFVYRKEIAKLQYEILKLTKPSLRSRRRDSTLLTVLGLAASAALGAGLVGWAPRYAIPVGVLGLTLSITLLMALQVRLSLAVKGEQDRMNDELQSARKKLRVLGEIVEGDREQFGLDSYRVRKLLAMTAELQAALQDPERRLDVGPSDVLVHRFGDLQSRLGPETYVPLGASEESPAAFTPQLDDPEDEAEENAPLEAAPAQLANLARR
jgi:glycosyltransferase involved in cell wall biosynthesis